MGSEVTRYIRKPAAVGQLMTIHLHGIYAYHMFIFLRAYAYVRIDPLKFLLASILLSGVQVLMHECNSPAALVYTCMHLLTFVSSSSNSFFAHATLNDVHVHTFIGLCDLLVPFYIA
jgi:hypothetical protein